MARERVSRTDEHALVEQIVRARADGCRRHLLECGIPELYADVEPDYEMARRVHKGGRPTGLYIVGDVGRGKTTLACAVAKAIVMEGSRASFRLPTLSFTSMPDLFTRIRATYSGGGEREEAVIGGYSSVDLLVLDDLGKGSCSDWALNIVYQILDRRVGAMLPTIVTTQFAVADLGAMLAVGAREETAKAIVSRLVGSCAIVPLGGPDRRMRTDGHMGH